MTTTPSQLLPTIVSRCRHERFRPVPAGVAERVLTALGAPPDKVMLAAASASGSIGRALEQLMDAGYWSLRDRVLESLAALKGSWSVAEAAQKLAGDKDNAPQVLEILETLARDRMRASLGLASAQSGPNPPNLPVDGEALLHGVLSARQKLSANVSWQTVLEMMYFDCLRGSISWQL